MTTFGPLDAECPTEDELITFRALMLGRNAFLPQIGVYYRKHKGSSSNPENFDKFPLEKIYEQQVRDMDTAIGLGIITAAQKERTALRLRKGIMRRQLYRRYFADRTFRNLLHLLISNKYNLRSKIHFIIDHFRRKRIESSS